MDFELNSMEMKKICDYNDEVDDDRTLQILVRLPVKSLLRFKSVCKSWCSLIESSFFINLHISTTTFNSSSNNFGSFILHVAVEKTEVGLRENALLMLSSTSASESRSSESASDSESGGSDVCCWWSSDPDVRRGGRWSSNWNKREDEEEEEDKSDDQVFEVDNLGFKLDSLGFPSCYKSSVIARVIGSCNGLICLFHGQPMDIKNMDFSFWNPATRQFRILPKPIIVHEDDGDLGLHLIAFGFDVETKDYKVVIVTNFKLKWSGEGQVELPCRVQVYSLSTDSWRLLEGITTLPGYAYVDTFEGQYLNGSCLFMARFLHSEQQQRWFPKKFIISLDLTKEIITTIQFPDHDTTSKNQKLYLSRLGDKMALFTVTASYVSFHGENFYDHEDYDIWVLNNEHKEESCCWTKLHSFQLKCGVPGKSDIFHIPKGISNDGEFALIETKTIPRLGKKMKLYNLVTKEVKKDFLVCHGVVSRAAEVYKPSLVSIIGGNGRSSR